MRIEGRTSPTLHYGPGSGTGVSSGPRSVSIIERLGHALDYYTLVCIGCGAPAELIEDTGMHCVGRE